MSGRRSLQTCNPLLLSHSQGAETFSGCDLREPGSEPRIPDGDVHLLRGVLRGLPLLLRQHLRGSHHHHLPRARRQDDGGLQFGKERGKSRGCAQKVEVESKTVIQHCGGDFAESLHRLCHQRQTPDTSHAPKQAELSIPDVGVCGFTAV